MGPESFIDARSLSVCPPMHECACMRAGQSHNPQLGIRSIRATNCLVHLLLSSRRYSGNNTAKIRTHAAESGRMQSVFYHLSPDAREMGEVLLITVASNLSELRRYSVQDACGRRMVFDKPLEDSGALTSGSNVR